MLQSFLFFIFNTSLSSLSLAKELPENQKILLTFPPCRQLCIFALGQTFKERCFNTSQALQARSTAFFNHQWHVLTMSVGLTISYQLTFCSSLVVCKNECCSNTWNLWSNSISIYPFFVLAARLNCKSTVAVKFCIFQRCLKHCTFNY